jgi:large subunit ribosomal protein L15
MSEQDSAPAYVPILSRLRPADGAVKTKRRKGRGPGSGLGKTAGTGQKGQKARHPGAFSKLAFEGGQLPLQRRLPKVGFWNPFTRHLATVNLSDLAMFEKGAVVDANALRAKRLVRGRFDGIKVLGDGELVHALTIRAHGFSKSALEKIAKVGGTAEVIALAPRSE